MANVKRAEVLASLRQVGERLSTARLTPSEDDQSPAVEKSIETPIEIPAAPEGPDGIVTAPGSVYESFVSAAQEVDATLKYAEIVAPIEKASLEAAEPLPATIPEVEPSPVPIAEAEEAIVSLNGAGGHVEEPASDRLSLLAQVQASADEYEITGSFGEPRDEPTASRWQSLAEREEDELSSELRAHGAPVSVPDETQPAPVEFAEAAEAPTQAEPEAVCAEPVGNTQAIADADDEHAEIAAPLAAASATDSNYSNESNDSDSEIQPVAEKEAINIWAADLRLPNDPDPPIRASLDALAGYKFTNTTSDDDPVARALRTIEEYRPGAANRGTPSRVNPAEVPKRERVAEEPVTSPKPESSKAVPEPDWNFNFEEYPEVTYNWLPRRGAAAILLAVVLIAAICAAVFLLTGAASRGKQTKVAQAHSEPAPPPVSSHPAAAPATSAKNEIRAAYDKLYKARASNVEAYMSMLTPDFRFTDRAKKTFDRADTQQMVKRSLPFWKSVNSWGTEMLEFQMDQGVATCVISEQFDNFFRDDEGRYGAKGARHRFKSSGVQFRDTWVKTDGGWKLSRSKAINQATETIDGNPVR